MSHRKPPFFGKKVVSEVSFWRLFPSLLSSGITALGNIFTGGGKVCSISASYYYIIMSFSNFVYFDRLA